MTISNFKLGEAISLLKEEGSYKIAYVDTINNRLCIETSARKSWKVKENPDAMSLGLEKILDPNKSYWWVWEFQINKSPSKDVEKEEMEAKAKAEAEALAKTKAEELIKAEAETLAKMKNTVKTKPNYKIGDWLVPNHKSNVPSTASFDEAWLVVGISNQFEPIIRVDGGWSKDGNSMAVHEWANNEDGSDTYWIVENDEVTHLASPAEKRFAIARDFADVGDVVQLMASAIPMNFKSIANEFVITEVDTTNKVVKLSSLENDAISARAPYNTIKSLTKKSNIKVTPSTKIEDKADTISLKDINHQQVESKEKKMANEAGVFDTLKKDSVSAGYRVAGRKLSKLAQQGLVLLFKSQGIKNKDIKSLLGLADTDLGRAAIAQLIGQGLPRIPMLKDNPKVLRLAEELRVESLSNGMEITLDGFLSGVSEKFMPQIMTIISELPGEETTSTTKHRIDAKAEVPAAPKAPPVVLDDEEEEEHPTAAKRARAA